jgi:tRNA A-37 threonylcarbamoyl transferase component Bud32
MREPTTAADVRRRYGVPDAIRLHVDARGARAWVEGAEEAAERVAAFPDALPFPEGVPAGRARLARLETPLGPVLVREARKGGLLARVRGRAFRGRWRPLDELVLARRLLGAGAPVADAVGAVVLRAPRGWRGFLLVREVEGAVDLEALLYGASPTPPLSRREALAAAGAAVRRLHDEGVEHADLHPKNLLVDGAGRRVLVIDLDRARAHDGPLPPAARLRNLARLGRSVEKHRLRGMSAGRREALRFLEAYAGGREAAAPWLERVRARLRRGLPAHVLWWRLTGQAGARGAAAPPAAAGAPEPAPPPSPGGAAA